MSISAGPARMFRPPYYGVLGLVLGAALTFAALLTPVFGPEPAGQDLAKILETPNFSHLMGTDQLGRDQLSRVAAGTRNSILTVLAVVAISGIGGGLTGLASGFIGGKTDLLVQRVVDAVMALPLIVVVLAVVTAVGGSFWTVSVAIGVAFAPVSVRVARASALTLRSSGYVDAARVSGASTARMVTRHLAPNAIGPWAIVAAGQAAAAVLVEAALAFLGVAPTRLTLGGLLGGDAQTYMYGAPWLIIWPGVVLALLALSVNLAGEWLADRAASIPES